MYQPTNPYYWIRGYDRCDTPFGRFYINRAQIARDRCYYVRRPWYDYLRFNRKPLKQGVPHDPL